MIVIAMLEIYNISNQIKRENRKTDKIKVGRVIIRQFCMGSNISRPAVRHYFDQCPILLTFKECTCLPFLNYEFVRSKLSPPHLSLLSKR